MHISLTVIIIAVCVLLISLGAVIYQEMMASTQSKSSDYAFRVQPQPTERIEQKITSQSTKASVRSYYGYASHIFTDAQGNSLHYYLYVPSHYNPKQKYPLVLLLHGGGERGKPTNTPGQNAQVLLSDPYAEVWSEDYKAPDGDDNPYTQQHWPCFVVVPQLETGQNWVNVPVPNGSYHQLPQPGNELLAAKELVDGLQKQYTNINANRLYITGLSLGGYGTWDAIERWPHYFAAAAPIAGAGDPSKASVLTSLPIWAFHGSADKTIPVAGSRDMITAIRAAGGNPAYTEFPKQGHVIWGLVYGFSTSPLRVTNFYPWLFAQHK